VIAGGDSIRKTFAAFKKNSSGVIVPGFESLLATPKRFSKRGGGYIPGMEINLEGGRNLDAWPQ
jgi:hypothetical protein